MTGHDNGLVTIGPKRMTIASKPCGHARTLSHPARPLRPRNGHYFRDMLVRDRGRLEACRAMFGDDRQDYGKVLQAYYDNGAPADWQSRFLSMYAMSHPWEDFAVAEFVGPLNRGPTICTSSTPGDRPGVRLVDASRPDAGRRARSQCGVSYSAPGMRGSPT